LDRNTTLQHFIDATQAAIRARATDHPGMMPMADRVFSALENAGNAPEPAATRSTQDIGARPSAARSPASRLPACRFFNSALDAARSGPGPIPVLAESLNTIEPDLTWFRRAGITPQDGEFYDSHANAIIVGKGGLAPHDAVTLGISLLAPGMPYPRHRHPPGELYVVLSSGKWMQNDGPLVGRGSGDLVCNGPNDWHAMQATDAPLLAVWCLWSDP
jgi:dimethlysulfoniopropionate lyase